MEPGVVTTAPRGADGANLAFAFGLVVIALAAAADLFGLPGGASAAQMAMVIGLALWFVVLLARRDAPFAASAEFAISIILGTAAFLCFWSFLSAAQANELVRAGRVVMTMVGAFAMLAFVGATMTERRVQITLIFSTLSVAAVCIFALAGYLIDPLNDLVFRGIDRAYATFKHPNQFGIVISTTVPITLALIIVGRGRIRTLAAISFGLLFMGLILSGSKTNILISTGSSFVVLVMVAMTSLSGQSRAIAILGILALALLGSSTVYIALDTFNPRALQILTDFFTGREEVRSLTSRSHIYNLSWEAFNSRPIFGVGAGKRIVVAPDGETIQHSHNMLLDYARVLGVPGAFGLAVILGTIIGFVGMTILAILFGGAGSTTDRVLAIGLGVSILNYTAANSISESFGPSTSMFFWLSVAMFFFVHGRLRRASYPTSSMAVAAA